MGTANANFVGRVAVEDMLQHTGIKGMRWGVRKDRGADRSAVTVTTKKGKGVVKVSGGKGRAASEDAVAKAAIRQKGKGSTVDALSTPELKAFVERKKLEEQYMSYVSKEKPRKSKGRKFVEDKLKEEWNSVGSGKTGPISGTAFKVAVAAGALGLGAAGKHRGVKMGSMTLATIRATGTGRHRK